MLASLFRPGDPLWNIRKWNFLWTDDGGRQARVLCFFLKKNNKQINIRLTFIIETPGTVQGRLTYSGAASHIFSVFPYPRPLKTIPN